MKKCLNCNSDIRDEDKYCRNCGVKVKKEIYYTIINVFYYII